MPSTYAHYCFGVQALELMPGDVRRTIHRFRQLFDVGLHGPDIFFYNNIFFKSSAGFLGVKYHDQTGEEFFTRVCRNLRLEPSEGGAAYLYGVLCHYCLDAVCHGYVRKAEAKGEVTHARLETEFDRRLLEMDGKVPPHTQDFSQHIHLTPGECETVARFYPPAGSANVKNSVKNMNTFVKLFAIPDGVRRRALEKSVAAVSKRYGDMLMTEQPIAQYTPYVEGLLEKYNKALAVFPEMLTQLQAHMTYSAPLREEFQKTFDGEVKK
mgnify:CR=1 FL=1